MVNEQHLEERASFVINTLLLPSQKNFFFAFCFCVLYTNVFWKKKLRNKLFLVSFVSLKNANRLKLRTSFDLGRKKT